MHINWRRGETRAFTYHKDGGPMPCDGHCWGRRDSYAYYKQESWGRRRMRVREALLRGEEMPRWRRTIRWDIW